MSLIKPDSRLHLLSVPLACLPLVLLLLYPSVGEWTVFVGRFHPVFLHLPIGILLLTTLLEFLQVISFGHLKFSTRTPLFFGTISAVAAMTLGVLLMGGESMEGALVTSHLQWGIATAVAAVVALSLRSLPSFSRRKSVPCLYRGALLLTCSIMAWASHQGASITHGETYLTAHIPWLADAGPSEAESELAAGIALPLEQREVYAHLIAPIFDSKCYECHQTRSFKGKLIMDTPAGLLAGGETGKPTIVPGSIEESLALTRIYLPIAHEDRMPPANEPQLTDQELSLIEWWVQQGAPFDRPIAALEVTPELRASIDTVSVELLAQLHQPKEAEHHELSAEDVAELRLGYNTEMTQLMETYPGMIRYMNGQSAEVSVSCFHEEWSDQELEAIAPIAPIIQEVILPSSHLTAASAEVLSQMTQLQVLDLRQASIDDSFILALDVPSVVRLNLFQTAITDAAAPALAKLQALNALYLGFTEMTPAGIESLQDQLSNCEIFFQQD